MGDWAEYTLIACREATIVRIRDLYIWSVIGRSGNLIAGQAATAEIAMWLISLSFMDDNEVIEEIAGYRRAA